MKLNTSTVQDESDERGFRDVLVDLPESLIAASRIEAKRLGLSLEQWVEKTVTAALSDDLAGDRSHG